MVRMRWAPEAVIGAVLCVCLVIAAAFAVIDRGTVSLPPTLTVYGFSCMDEALAEGVFPAFQERQVAGGGQAPEFISTFAGSGRITATIIDEVPVHVALLASEMDAYRLSTAGKVPGRAWRHLPEQGVVSRSRMVILVREGNPLDIRSYADLLRPDVALLLCDPTTSGAGEWTLLALYAALLERTGSPQLARAALPGVLDHVEARPASARQGLRQFVEEAVGDALVIYESAWRTLPDEQRSRLVCVVPDPVLLSEHVVVRLDRNVASDQAPLVRAFVEFLWSDEAQACLVEQGFEPASGDPRRAPETAGSRILRASDFGDLYELQRILQAIDVRP